MATTVEAVTLPAGFKVLEVMQFNFYNCKSTNVAERKGDFTLKFRSGVMDSDGGYREDTEPVLILSGDETKLMMSQDKEVTLTSGKKLTGAEVAECLGIVADRAWAGEYHIEPVEEEEEEDE